MADKSGFKQINEVRRVTRGLFLDGYRAYREYMDFDSDSTYRSRKNKVREALGTRMEWSDDGKWLQVSSNAQRLSDNPLFGLYESSYMNSSQYAFYFAMLELLDFAMLELLDHVEGLTHSEILRKIGDEGSGLRFLLDSESNNALTRFLENKANNGSLNRNRCYHLSGKPFFHGDPAFEAAYCIVLHILLAGTQKTERQIKKEFKAQICDIKNLNMNDDRLNNFVETACTNNLLHRNNTTFTFQPSSVSPNDYTQQQLILALLFQTSRELSLDEIRGRLNKLNEHLCTGHPADRALEQLTKHQYITEDIRYSLCRARDDLPNRDFYEAKLPLILSGRRKLTANEIWHDMKQYIGMYSLPVDEDSKSWLTNNLRYFIRAGIIEESDKKYRLVSPIDSQILGNYPGLTEAIKFFTHYDPLGLIGQFIMDGHSLTNNDTFWFKDYHIVQALDTHVLFDMLQFIHNKQCIQITKDTVFKIPDSSKKRKTEKDKSRSRLLPLHILTSISTGQRYLFAYDLDKNEFTSTRLDYIYRYTVLEAAIDIQAVVEKSIEIRKHMWGATVKKLPTKATIVIDAGKIRESAQGRTLYALLDREKRNGDLQADATTGNLIYETTIYQPRDMVPWLLTYTGHLLSITEGRSKHDKNGALSERLALHIEDMYRMYHQLARCKFSVATKHSPIEQKVLVNANKLDPSSLFQPIYSKYTRCLRDILLELRTPNSKSRKDIQRLIERKKTQYQIDIVDKRVSFDEMLESGMLQECDENTYCSFLVNQNSKLRRPLTDIEIRWLKTILNDEKINLFLTQEEVKQINEQLLTVEPLYNKEDFVFFDRYQSTEHYRRLSFQQVFRSLNQAIQEKQEVEICYQKQTEAASNSEPEIVSLQPLKIEYSFQLDRFYLMGILTQELPENSTLKSMASYARDQKDAPKKVLILMSDIQSVTRKSKRTEEQQIDLRELECRTPITLRLYDIYEACQRFLITFSAYRKKVQFEGLTEYPCKDGGTTSVETCLVELWYYERDRNDVLTKLRSFGRAVQVLRPLNIRKTIIRRVNKQYRLFVKAQLIPEITEKKKVDPNKSTDKK